MIFIFVLVVLIVLTYIEALRFPSNCMENSRKGGFAFFIIAGAICLIEACRYQVGQDWGPYSEIFADAYNPSLWGVYEKGYLLLNRLIGLLTNNYYILQFSINIFCGIIIFRFLYKKTNTPFFILLVYYVCQYCFLLDMSLNRLYLAVGILVLGNRFIEKRKLIAWVLIVLLAMQFHVTAILAFPLFWTTRMKISRKNALIMILVSFIITLFGFSITTGILNLIQKVPFLPERFGRLIQNYLFGDLSTHHQNAKTGFGIIAEYLIYIILTLLHDKEGKQNKDKYFMNFILAILIQAFGVNFDLLRRIANFYMIAGGGLIVYNLLNEGIYVIAGRLKFKERNVLFVRVFLITIFVAFRTISFVKAWDNSLSNDFGQYKTIFESF